MNKIEKQLFEQILSLNLEETKNLLQNNKFDFNKMKSERGYGFLYTILRRFNDDDFISEEVDFKDLYEMIKLLLENGVEINQETATCHHNPKYDFGSVLSAPVVTSLHLKNTDLADLLIEHGADVNYEDGFGNIPLFFANHYNLIIKYIEKTNNPFHINKQNENALFYQVKNLRVMKFLLDYGLDPYLINSHGDNLVLHCIRYGSPDVLDYLLKTLDKLEVNYTNPITKETVLFTVKHKKMLDVLVKYNLKLDLLNDLQQTVLFTTHNKSSFVKTLIKYNLDINHQDYLGDTVLHKPDTESLIEILAASGFNFNLKNKMGDTVIDVYKKRNAKDLYGGHQNTIDLILDRIQEQERVKQAKEKQELNSLNSHSIKNKEDFEKLEE